MFPFCKLLGVTNDYLFNSSINYLLIAIIFLTNLNVEFEFDWEIIKIIVPYFGGHDSDSYKSGSTKT